MKHHLFRDLRRLYSAECKSVLKYLQSSRLVKIVLFLLITCAILHYSHFTIFDLHRIFTKNSSLSNQARFYHFENRDISFENKEITDDSGAEAIYNDYFITENQINSSSNHKEPCPIVSPYLRGALKPIQNVSNNISDVEDELGMIGSLPAFGGFWQPRSCRARTRVALIVPYRNRLTHLTIFLRNMHPFLQSQQIGYGIFVVEQTADSQPFNKAMIMNAAFVEVNKTGQFSCYIFHDIDLLPEDDRNVYKCAEQPRHLSVAIDKFEYRYKLLYTSKERYRSEGLNSLTYRRIVHQQNQLFTWLLFELPR
ncbi:beta-1,4-galactosyltransferase 6 isoform X2 [Nilaparvata lugens]|uniref:beta-1,4-galactosyltransferase 6 isoform X2 n=1 Tax=Nilaparvata lugens TaxID=108931 RepID=UPI00193D8D03|nr:beta-1,4-galactosyltransferase 6 isoform X2 [Nilaparvata lugens]